MRASAKKTDAALRGGYTLVEFLVAIGLLVLIGMIVYQFTYSVITYSRILTSQLIAQNEVRKTVDVMVEELRTMATSDSGAYPIEAAATSSLTFYSSIDNTPSKERVRYFLQGSTLEKGVIQATGTPPTYPAASEVVTPLVNLIVNGTTSIFSYYDGSYGGTSSPLTLPVIISSVRYIKLSVIVDDNNRSPNPIMVTSSVTLRNLKDNF
ncbi:MAG: hypothetical protein HY220_02525 [Candidatus Sungbacteria bacterium]|uniref:Prepilin-type N-terminal cleavage/methylation domain-containing protein n=1 Tax=Candidatus Sungiibacteriota bacterium TaxID=2750080 RepID=A0A9D6QYN5_9BACT|nr:hypothetical protein [Candidatus Sungbacteria bacterium]